MSIRRRLAAGHTDIPVTYSGVLGSILNFSLVSRQSLKLVQRGLVKMMLGSRRSVRNWFRRTKTCLITYSLEKLLLKVQLHFCNWHGSYSGAGATGVAWNTSRSGNTNWRSEGSKEKSEVTANDHVGKCKAIFWGQ